MAKTWSEIEDEYQDYTSEKPKQIFAYYVYINGIPTKYDKVPDIPVKYRKIAVREETAESKKEYAAWLIKTKAQATMYDLWKSELRKDLAKSLNDKQFALLLNYVSQLSDDYDMQANYMYELATLFHNVSIAK